MSLLLPYSMDVRPLGLEILFFRYDITYWPASKLLFAYPASLSTMEPTGDSRR